MQGSGNIETESRSVSDFTAVEVSGSAKVILEQGDTESLTITADDNLLQYIKSEVHGPKLSLGTEGLVSISPTEEIVYKLSVKKLNGLVISGDVSVEASGVRTESLTVAVSGAGKIKLSGEAREQNIAISGIADYQAENFKTAATSIAISGSGNAVVAASANLMVHVSGAGSVEYVGNPKVEKSISGAGTVQARTP
jgi:hypothetical protein